MKRFFKFALVALATAAVAVACQKPEQQPEKIALKGISLNKQAVELAIGAKETLTVKFDPENVTEKPTIEWSSSAPAVATVAEGEVTAVAAGEATITAKAGSFTATCKVTVKEEQPEPGDFTSPDWANIGAITNGNHTFKFTKDDKNAYFFSERTSEGRYNEIWGGKGYIYFAFDFDNDLTTGVELNGNGKYEYIGFIYCFGEKPKVEIVKAGDCLPEAYTVDNIIARGSADDNSVKVEYCVPLADLPQLPENFTIYTWGNKDMAKVIYKYPYEAPAAPQVASWAEAEAAGAIHFFQYLSDASWTPYPGYESVEAASFDNLTVANGVYTLTLDKVCPETWNAQLFMRPNPEIATLPLKADKRYLVSLTIESSVEYSPFVKFCQYKPELNDNGEPKHEGATIYEWGSVHVKANTPKTLAYVFEGVECGNVNFTLGLGGYTESATVIIKDIKVEVTDRELGLIDDDPGTVAQPWDYTPSEEYKAASNLWKSIDDAGALSFFYHYPAAGYPAANADTYELLSKNQSTYVLNCPVAAAEGLWSNQLFMYPKEGHFIALDPAKTYKFKVTLGSNKDFPGFFKMTTYNPDNVDNHVEGAALWETNYEDGFFFDGGKPVVVETELTGKEANNIVLIFAFGKNPKECEVYIKDIIVEEVGGEGPVAETVYTLTDANLPTAYEKDAGGSYVETIVTEENIQYNIFTVANYGNGIQIRKEGGYISNHTAFESIKTIKVTCHPDKSWYPSNLVLYAGTAENPSETVITAESDDNTSTFDLSAGNYTHFKLANTSTYAVYLEKVEITGEAGEAPAPAASIKLDGDLSDWDAVEGVEAGSFKEFKFASDADNIYMYFKIKRAKIIAAKTEPFVFNWRRYIAFGIDADNNAETGTAVTFAGMNIPGCEIGGNFYPFRGTATSASGTDNVEIVNGVEEQGGVTTEIGSNVPDGADKKVSAFGKVDDEFVYVEAGFARADVGSPAAGTIKIQLSLAWDLTDILEYSLK